jgi:hypothetical protein
MFKRIFAFLVLSFAFLGTQCWAQTGCGGIEQPPCGCVPGEGGQFCTFAAGTNSSVTATFDCPSGQTPCPDPGAHSIKFTVGMASPGLSISVTANKRTGDGICDSGMPGGPDPEPGTSLLSIDCRFVRFFGDPAYNNEPPVGPNNPNTKVPFCYPYALDPLGQPTCVVYSVTGPDPGPTTYSNGVQFRIAWNNVVSTPPGYFHSPRMFDDPHNDHPTPAQLANASNCPAIDLGNDNVFPYEPDQFDDNQFVCDITTFFDPKPNTVGTDPTSGGSGRTFNDFVVAWRFCKAKQDDVEGDGHEQGDDGHEGDFEFCQRSKEMRFEERDTGTKMNGSMDAVTLSGNQAIITGAGTLGDGTPVHYTAVVLGNAPVIGANHFAISWITATGSLFQTSGALIDGFIVVPTLPPL